MEYAIQDVAQIIGAKTNTLHDCTISILLTDSRRLSFPESSLFFALATKTNDGHRYVQDLYKLRVRNFVVSKMLPEFEQMEEANWWHITANASRSRSSVLREVTERP